MAEHLLIIPASFLVIPAKAGIHRKQKTENYYLVTCNSYLVSRNSYLVTIKK